MERDTEAVAMAKAIDSGGWKWVVGWNGSIRCDPQDLASQGIQILCVIREPVISIKNIEHAIRTELDDPAVMNTSSREVEDEFWRGVGCDSIPTRRHGHKPSDTIDRATCATCSVEHIYEAVLAEIRRHRDTQQPFLIPGLDGKCGKRFGLQLPRKSGGGCDHPDISRDQLGHKDASVRSRRHRGREMQAVRNFLKGELPACPRRDSEGQRPLRARQLHLVLLNQHESDLIRLRGQRVELNRIARLP